MYFFKQKGKQVLDMRGDLVLSHNDAFAKGRVKSAAPASMRNVEGVINIPRLGFFGKFRTTFVAIIFIWGKSEALTIEEIEKDGI